MPNMRKLEIELNEHLYNQIFLLTLEHKTTKDFNVHFKRNMFAKNNKAACHHVLHFLLNVLDPVAFKQKICWPLLYVKMEPQFLSDVIKYVNELADLHEDSGLPNLAKSHLQSAGGYKFLRFMNSLTQFVFYEVLKRSDTICDVTLLCTKENDTGTSVEDIKNLEYIIDGLYIKIATEQAKFNGDYELVKKIAKELNDEKEETEQLFINIKCQFREIDEQSKLDLEAIGDKLQDFEILKETIKQKLKLLKMKDDTISNCAEFVDILHNYKTCVKYDKTNIKSDSVLQILESFYNTIKANKHIATYGSKTDFSEDFDNINKVLESLNETLCKYEVLNSEILDFHAHLENIISTTK